MFFHKIYLRLKRWYKRRLYHSYEVVLYRIRFDWLASAPKEMKTKDYIVWSIAARNDPAAIAEAKRIKKSYRQGCHLESVKRVDYASGPNPQSMIIYEELSAV